MSVAQRRLGARGAHTRDTVARHFEVPIELPGQGSRYGILRWRTTAGVLVSSTSSASRFVTARAGARRRRSMAHLAGALGLPVWILLAFAPDWRWLRDRSDSLWYSTARLFRQEEPGDWDGVIERVRRVLQAAAPPA
jgi:hypothetical protein